MTTPTSGAPPLRPITGLAADSSSPIGSEGCERPLIGDLRAHPGFSLCYWLKALREPANHKASCRNQSKPSLVVPASPLVAVIPNELLARTLTSQRRNAWGPLVSIKHIVSVCSFNTPGGVAFRLFYRCHKKRRFQNVKTLYMFTVNTVTTDGMCVLPRGWFSYKIRQWTLRRPPPPPPTSWTVRPFKEWQCSIYVCG